MTPFKAQTFWITRDVDGNATVHDLPPDPALGRTRLSVAGPNFTPRPSRSMPPDRFAAWVEQLQKLGYVVTTMPAADPPGR